MEVYFYDTSLLVDALSKKKQRFAELKVVIEYE